MLIYDNMFYMNEKVKVTNNIYQNDYTEEAQTERIKYIDQIGLIIKERNSHGLCYDVKFPDGIATYDPDELEFQ